MARRNYKDEHAHLVRAFEIKLELDAEYLPDWPDRARVMEFARWQFDQIKNPPKEEQNLRGLQFWQSTLLTYYNESSGPDVETFWKRLAEEGIPYERVDQLGRMLERGKIRGRTEYDVAVDSLVAAEQEGRITTEEATKLSAMIGAYENRKRGRKGHRKDVSQSMSELGTVPSVEPATLDTAQDYVSNPDPFGYKSLPPNCRFFGPRPTTDSSGPVVIDPPAIVRTERQETAVLGLGGTMAEAEQAMTLAYAELRTVLADQGLTPVGPLFTMHFGSLPGRFQLELGLPTNGVVSRQGRIRPAFVPAYDVATTIHHGPYEELGSAWDALMTWLSTTGCMPASDAWEFYLCGPETTSDSTQWRTQLMRPLLWCPPKEE